MLVTKFILCSSLALAEYSAAADSNADFAPPPATTTTTPAASSATPSGASINPAALAAMASQQQAAMMNALASAALFTACLAPRPPAMPLCAMGALAAMQSGADSGAFGDSSSTATASQQGANGATLGNGAGSSAYKDPSVAAGMQALKNGGYTVTDTGVTNPDGTTTPASAFSSPSAMAAAGIDAKTIDASQRALASIDTSSLPKVSGVGVSEGGGAGGVGAGGAGDDGSGSARGRIYNPFALNGKQKKQIVAGKTIMLDGEPIGVKGQNLFDMVHVAYQRKRDGNHFLENASGTVPGAASSRIPASTNINNR